jgi:uncharacterized protein (TIGR00369 family)
MNPTANEGVSAFSGLKYFQALMEGSVARSSMLELFDINIEAAEPGLVVLTAIPTAEHYNPLGFVHGGYAAVLLDTCMAAAIVTSLEPGLSPVTLPSQALTKTTASYQSDLRTRLWAKRLVG